MSIKIGRVIKNIFSVRNEEIHKVITVLGIKLKLKSRKLEQRAIIREYESKINKLSKTVKIYQKSLNDLQEDIEKKISTLKNDHNDLLKKHLNEYALDKKRIYARLNSIYSWQCDFYKDNPKYFHVELTDNERDTLCKYIRESQNYLEFGAGGSTFLAAECSNLNVYSVESDDKWLDLLRSYKFIYQMEESGRLKFYHVDIGKIKGWGYPVDDSLSENYYRYSSKVYKSMGVVPDLVFVDGRFRVACILFTIMSCSHDTKIIVHDYTIREKYHVVEEFLDIIEISDTLVVFKIKQNIPLLRIQELYDEYKQIKD